MNDRVLGGHGVPSLILRSCTSNYLLTSHKIGAEETRELLQTVTQTAILTVTLGREGEGGDSGGR